MLSGWCEKEIRATSQVEKLWWEKVSTTNVSDVEYVEFEHFPKTVEQKSLECKITLLKDEMKTGFINLWENEKMESVQNQLT